MTVEATFSLGVNGQNSTASQLRPRASSIAASFGFQFSNGVGANQVSQSYTRERTAMAASTNDDLDLNGTALQEDSGANLALTGVKVLAIRANAANPGPITVGNAAANAFVGPMGAATHTVVIPPGGSYSVARADAAGWVVTPGTGDILRIASAATAGTYAYDLVVLGI